MKKILISLLLLSTQAVGQDFNDLVSRTMKGKLTPNDFNSSKNYMMLIDTLGNWNNSMYLKFNNTVNITNETNRLSKLLKEFKVIDTIIYHSSEPNLKKNHITAHLQRHNKTYVFEWWFEGEDNKLSAVTMMRK